MIGSSDFFVCSNETRTVLGVLSDDAEDFVNDISHQSNASGTLNNSGDKAGPKESSASFYRAVQPKTLQQVMELIFKPGLEEAYRKRLLILERLRTTVIRPGCYAVVQ